MTLDQRRGCGTHGQDTAILVGLGAPLAPPDEKGGGEGTNNLLRADLISYVSQRSFTGHFETEDEIEDELKGMLGQSSATA